LNSDELKYIEIVKNRYPGLDISKIEFNKTDGSYSDIAVVNNEEVFKFAKYDWSAAYLKNEADVIRFIKDFIALPLPDTELIGQNVSRRRYIKGSPLYRNILLKLDYRTQNTVAWQIATFLKQLHSIPTKIVQRAKIGDSQMNLPREDWLAELETMQRKIFPYCTSYVREYLQQVIQPVMDNEKFFEFKPALIHGDLTPNHILFDQTSRMIKGIIGFGNAGAGDPSYDLGMLMDHLGEGFIKRMQKYYPITPACLDRARFYAYISNFMWMRDVCDMISTRDFSRFKIPAKDRDISPLGTLSR
jgi:aminoglycoside 2''-phosphotransferase